MNSKISGDYFTLNNSGNFVDGIQKNTNNIDYQNLFQDKENENSSHYVHKQNLRKSMNIDENYAYPLQEQKANNIQTQSSKIAQNNLQNKTNYSFLHKKEESNQKINTSAIENDYLSKKINHQMQNSNNGPNSHMFQKVNDVEGHQEDNHLVKTFNTECPLSSERFIQQSHSNTYSKIFIPVILEQKMSNSQIKAGSLIVDLYKIESQEQSNDNFTVYTGLSLIEESKNEKVTIKIYEPSCQGFNLGLKEITNYLHLYEFNLQFHESGISKLRDFFYFRNKLVIVTDHGHNIMKINKRYLSLNSIKTIMQKAFKIIENLYNLSVIHLNLNPQSINYYFFKQTINICISDFQYSQQIENSYTCNFDTFEYSDIRYQAPEIILGIEYTSKSDIWSLGCIMYELLTGEVLFKTNDKKEIIFIIKKVFENDEDDGYSSKDGSILNNKYIESFQASLFMDQNNISRDMSISSSNNSTSKKIHEMNEKILEIKQNFNLLRESSLLYDFLRYVLSPNPDQRPSIEEVLQHIWIQDK